MKTLMTITLILSSLSIQAQSMQKYLSDTEKMIRQGKYEEALERCQWFHDHSLEHQPSFYGVRLSYALNDWKSLADVYPPAMEALTETRDRKTNQLIDNGGTRDLFADVEAINQTLGETTRTIELYENIIKSYPDSAQSYWRYIREALFNSERYDLIGKVIGSPILEFSDVVKRYNWETSWNNDQKTGRRRLKRQTENTFVEHSIRLIQYAIAADDEKSAKDIQQKALSIVEDHRLSKAIPDTKK